MTLSELETRIRYVTNAAGERTDVLVPVELWQKLMDSLNSNTSGLDWIDEKEPKAQILADLQESLQQAAAGQTFPVSQLWDAIINYI